LSGPLRGPRIALLICGAVVALDQGSKAVVNAHVVYGDQVDVLPLLAITNTQNRGIAFGLAGGASPALIGVTVVAVVGLLGFLLLQVKGPWIWLAGGLLLGGALGNLADRVREGAVTDFIDLPLWPTFNLADVAIVAGVIALLFAHEREGTGPKPNARGG
jgi:signal peptidase II